ncbi:ATP-binding protein [Dactylosporangium sp. NPDC048998]|uniref:ATP-binding protein n=1 Tax=Dactylosporangium sp. NPDC048998 TaxID=3363976 RepID=UPI00372176D6
MARRLLDQALHTLGVDGLRRDDIGLILTEACANVIAHALQIDDYEITIDVTSERCVIHVVNAGAVVDPAWLRPSSPRADSSPGGRFCGALPAASPLTASPLAGSALAESPFGASEPFSGGFTRPGVFR